MYPLEFYFIDHYDSFSFNVVDWLCGNDCEIRVRHIQFDDTEAMAAIVRNPLPVVISPGPRHPVYAESTMTVVEKLLGHVPILGICLGHQILGTLGGFPVVRSAEPFHGSALEISVLESGNLFTGLPSKFMAATYNSLIVGAADSFPADWRVAAVNTAGEIQALTWKMPGKFPAFGIQFHPESFLTEYGAILRKNWLQEVDCFYRPKHITSATHTSATAPLSMPS
jgi:anthranilate synthase/aminodeoxychorismate synthase-like glutamine amidotransferase